MNTKFSGMDSDGIYSFILNNPDFVMREGKSILPLESAMGKLTRWHIIALLRRYSFLVDSLPNRKDMMKKLNLWDIKEICKKPCPVRGEIFGKYGNNSKLNMEDFHVTVLD